MATNIMTTKMKKAESNSFDALGLEDDITPESWEGLPEFVQKANDAEYRVVVQIRNKEDLIAFADLIGVPSLAVDTKRSTKSIWYPAAEKGDRGKNCLYVWMDADDPELENLNAK